MRFAKVDQRLQAAAHIISLMHVARDSTNNRVNDEQRNSANSFNGPMQFWNILRRVEWEPLTVLCNAVNEVASLHVGA